MAAVCLDDGTSVRFCCGCRTLHSLEAFDGPSRSCRRRRRAAVLARPVPVDALQDLVHGAGEAGEEFVTAVDAVARAFREQDVSAQFHGLLHLSTVAERTREAQDTVVRALFDQYIRTTPV